MQEGDCEHCGGHYKNLGAHMRFCKKNPANMKETEAPELPEGEEELPEGLSPEDIQEPQEPPQDRMFRVPQDSLDRYGYPYMTITQSRLLNDHEAVRNSDIQTDIVTLTMKTTPYGPCSIIIPKKDVEEGRRSLEPFIGNRIFEKADHYEILMMRSDIRKYYYHLHTIPTESGRARWEDIQRNALMISPEGSPLAPPPIMYSSHYSNQKKHPTMDAIKTGIDKE